MQPTFVYSGTFDPPTYGHFALLSEAVKFFPHIRIVCTDYSQKNPKFSQEERVALWQSYGLPSSVTVQSLSLFTEHQIPGESIVLIRGLRDVSDGEHEAKVLLSSAQNAGITKTFTVIAPEKHRYVSSSLVWELAEKKDWENLAQIVSKEIATEVMKRYPSLNH